jgi:hypothetical protein
VLALVSFMQGAFLWRADRTTAKALATAAKQTEIANKQYIASNRPILRIRLLSVSRPEVGELIPIRYEVINVGGTRARIVSNQVTVRLDVPVGGERKSFGATRQFYFADFLAQGEALPAEGKVLRFQPEWGLDPQSNWFPDRLWISGVIRYMDDNGVLRRTGFFRVATHDLNRFTKPPGMEPTTSGDHEYED